MPTYTYVCRNCGNEQDERGGLEQTTSKCSVCEGETARLPCSGLPYIRGETVAKYFPNATKDGDIKNKHGQYRVDLWNENAGEVKRAREKQGISP
jgi:putative FmdB family regulatory protein